jgi:hypothetical protein
VLKATIPKFKTHFSVPHFNYLCSEFVTSFVSRGIIQTLYKCKRISNAGPHQLLLDVATISDNILNAVGMIFPSLYLFFRLLRPSFAHLSPLFCIVFAMFSPCFPPFLCLSLAFL